MIHIVFESTARPSEISGCSHLVVCSVSCVVKLHSSCIAAQFSRWRPQPRFDEAFELAKFWRWRPKGRTERSEIMQDGTPLGH